MGMFDSVKHKCICGETIEWQSKEGECRLHDYDVSDVPVEIAKNIEGEMEVCRSCGKEYIIYISPRMPKSVRMFVQEV